jgi:hypothetical protein
MYAHSDGGVAIRSTVAALQDAFGKIDDRQSDLIISQAVRRVVYIDYRTEHPDINDLAGPLCYKRKAFTFEQEIRVIRQELPTGPASDRPEGRAILIGPAPQESGREIPVNIDALIDAVHLAPSSPAWMFPAIQETLHRFHLRAKCEQSSLDELPESHYLSSELREAEE